MNPALRWARRTIGLSLLVIAAAAPVASVARDERSAALGDPSADARPYPFFRSPLRPVDHPAQRIEVRRGLFMAARDGNRLAIDLYLPPGTGRHPTIVMRTPYGKERAESALRSLAQYGYAVMAQDCRGTGASEPGQWDQYMYEKEDSYDTVEWVKAQPWADGKIGGIGGSYVGETQWFMALHPGMTAILPQVAGIGGGPSNGVRLHMFINAYARTVGKSGGQPKASMSPGEMEKQTWAETLASGYYNEPLRPPAQADRALERFPELKDLPAAARGPRMLQIWAGLTAADRTDLVRFLIDAPQVTYANIGGLPSLLNRGPAFKYVAPSTEDVYRALHAPPLMLTGWYDWGLNLSFQTWELLHRHAPAHVRDNAYLVITPVAHNSLGYQEGADRIPALRYRYSRVEENLELIVRWYDHWLKGRAGTLAGLAPVTYYLMGANEWRGAEGWPPPDGRPTRFFLDSSGQANGPDGLGTLTEERPGRGRPDRFVYDPSDPPPTTGGSIVSSMIPSGSTDQRDVEKRPDVLVYSTAPLTADLEVAGSLKVVLFASSSAVDTDFTAKLTDVFPDGRALVLQSGIVRARFRDREKAASLLEPGRVYEYEVDLWATANLFRRGHRVRLEIASADFPRYERNANLGGRAGAPVKATQTVFHDAVHPSHLVLHVVPRP
jgi:hypothetical protein